MRDLGGCAGVHSQSQCTFETSCSRFLYHLDLAAADAAAVRDFSSESMWGEGSLSSSVFPSITHKSAMVCYKLQCN